VEEVVHGYHQLWLYQRKMGNSICVDFKKLNETTKKDPFPLPFTYEVLNKVARCDANYFWMDI
jgi:hypothetical protein